MKSNGIFKTRAGKILGQSLKYLGKYITGKPLVMNLNLNVTNLCNQNCPMCNSVIVGKGVGKTITFEQFRDYLDILKPHGIASMTVSGGEPSLVKDISAILDYSAGEFPFGVNVNSNLYGGEKIIVPFAESALKNNIRIGTSFDGLGETADKLRGAKDVAKRVLRSIELVTRMRKEMDSGSTLNMHTVISDQNIEQVPDILAISEKYGWTHTLAPVNNFFYQDSKDPNTPILTYTDKLDRIIELALTKKNISVSRSFLKNIPLYAKGDAEKLCPYLSGIFKTYKVFLDPNGDLSLCSREPIGNIRDSSLAEMLSGQRYAEEKEVYSKCPGCWMACFVEILLAMPRPYQLLIRNKF